jgi:dihydrofolate reductase
MVSDKSALSPGDEGGAPPLTIVAAIARNRALGKDNAIPWRAPSDLKRFRDITWGRPMIMGRKTYQSIGKPLPGRETVVVTRDPGFPGGTLPERLHVARDFDAALTLAARLAHKMGASEVILAGGAELYRLGLPRAKFLRLTFVDCAPEADAFFPEIDWRDWRELRRECPALGATDDVALEYGDYQRIEG